MVTAWYVEWVRTFVLGISYQIYVLLKDSD